MTGPNRILDEADDGLSARLLRSASADTPNERSWHKALAAVGAATATSAAGSGVAAATVGGQGLLIGKWIGLGLLSGALVATGLSALRERARPAAPPPPVPVAIDSDLKPVRPELAPASPASPAPAHSPARASDAKQAPQSRGRAADVVPRSAPPATPATPSVAAFAESPAPSLAEEQRWVERVRQRLAAGDASGALAEADAYDKQFKPRRFGQEVSVLRIDALVRLGRCAQAQSLAQRFLVAHPDSALAQRVSSLTAPCGG